MEFHLVGVPEVAGILHDMETGVEITPMKLQKILYYVCVKYVKETGIFPIYERFEVWKYGPVIPSVYSEFKTFGASPIKKSHFQRYNKFATPHYLMGAPAGNRGFIFRIIRFHRSSARMSKCVWSMKPGKRP